MARSRSRNAPHQRRRSRSKRKTSKHWLIRSGLSLIRTIRVLPPTAQVLVGVVFILTVWYGINWSYQVYQKPTEVFFPLSRPMTKNPPETWQHYGPLFTQQFDGRHHT